jgi:hypothetical protein
MMMADSATLKLDNQKNGWKAACIHQEVNGEHIKCPVRALARRVIHLRQNKANGKTFLCKVYAKEGDRYVCAGDVSAGLKVAASILQYPLTRGIPISSVDTHSLRSGGANALSPLCRMSACRFCCPNGDILCRVGDMSRHVAGHVADTRKCRVGRVSKTTRHLTTCRGIPDMSVGNFVIVV